jgi:predicted aldo/keto reductase-like oxidoreductase
LEKRLFPSIGREISLLGFGLMRLPTFGGQAKNIDYPTVEKMVDRALEAGINYFDTAYVYHEGESETNAGRALSRHNRADYHVATKLPLWIVSSAQRAESIFAEQLQKLQTDYIDFYLAHNIGASSFKILEDLKVYDILSQKKQAGQIRYLGFSVHDSPQHLDKILAAHDWDFAQIQLNYIDWVSLKSEELYQKLTAKNIPVIIMEPVRGGALANLPADAEKLLRTYDPKASSASWALRFAASLPGVMTVLSGMSAPDQMEDNLATFSSFKPLNDAERVILDKVATSFRLANAVPCTGCRYCMDCPQGVNIPINLSIYNQYRAMMLENQQLAPLMFGNYYRTLVESEQAVNCLACGECSTHCPQNISISDHLKQIADLAASISDS